MTRGRIDVDLLEEERLARRHFVGLGIAVARRPALDDVRDVDVGALEADRLDDLRQQLPGASDERLALEVLVGARRLADEHELRVRVADAEHDLPPAKLVQLAARAVADVFSQRQQDSALGAGLPGACAGRP